MHPIITRTHPPSTTAPQMLQDRGREADVPALALAALGEQVALGEDVAFTPAMMPAMQLVLVGLLLRGKTEQQCPVSLGFTA